MNKFIIITVTASAIILIAGIVLISSKEQNSQEQTEQALEQTSLADSDQTKGNKDAPVTLIEYSDFQCPACAAYHSVLKQLNEEFGQDLLIIYRHYPLRQAHKHAELAARAAEAAGKQGKFWEMHDKLFENQSDWSEERKAEEIFIEYAQSLDLNLDQFKSNLDSSEIKDKVTRDYQSGLRLGVSSTPSFFLNKLKLRNPQNYEEFKGLVQAAISKEQ